jgi:hypothetical protein
MPALSHRTPLAIIAALALAGAGVAGCGTETLNTDKAETEIAKGIEQQTGVKASVDCPDDIEIKKDDTFTCTAKPEDGGESGTVTVTQKDDEGNISWELK